MNTENELVQELLRLEFTLIKQSMEKEARIVEAPTGSVRMAKVPA